MTSVDPAAAGRLRLSMPRDVYRALVRSTRELEVMTNGIVTRNGDTVTLETADRLVIEAIVEIFSAEPNVEIKTVVEGAGGP